MMSVHKMIDILHHLRGWIIAVKSGQADAVRNLLDRVNMVPFVDLSQYARMADDSALLHAPDGVLYGF